MTNQGKTPDEPRTRQATTGPSIPHPQMSEEDLAELKEPYELPFPENDRWPQDHPRPGSWSTSSAAGSPAGPPSLAELLETGTRTREPEPGLEAEP